MSISSQKYEFGIRDPRSGIRNKPIPDPGSRGQKGPNPGSRIRNTGWQNLPATLEILTSNKEKELLTCLIKDVNSVFFTGLDENPDYSRSAARPLVKKHAEKKKNLSNATLTVGGSNASRMAEALANLGMDSYKLSTPGWKLNKENVEKIVPDLKEILETIPKDAPVIFFCLDNTVFKVATAEGELTNISKCVAEDDGYHINGSLVVAPDFFIRNQIELLKTLVALGEGHMIIILCPVPRYVTFRCCDDPNHCTNYNDPSYLSTLLNDLPRIRDSLTKGIPSAVTLDTLEVLIGKGEKNFATKEEAINTCWSQDPVHANLHTYFKLASNTIQLIEEESKTDTNGGMRQRANSCADSQSGSGSGHGSGSGTGDGSAPKKQKTSNKSGYPGSQGSHGGSGQGFYGGGGFSGELRPGGGGHHDARLDNRYDYGGYYASQNYRQRRNDFDGPPPSNYHGLRGDSRGRRFQGRRPYRGGGRGRH